MNIRKSDLSITDEEKRAIIEQRSYRERVQSMRDWIKTLWPVFVGFVLLIMWFSSTAFLAQQNAQEIEEQKDWNEKHEAVTKKLTQCLQDITISQAVLVEQSKTTAKHLEKIEEHMNELSKGITP